MRERWWRRVQWQVVLIAAVQLAVTLLLVGYLNQRRTDADQRAEMQRGAICSILAALPPTPPPTLLAARRAFTRQGHPHDCEPVRRRARPTATPTATVTAAPTSGAASTSAPAAGVPSAPPIAATPPARPSSAPSRTPPPPSPTPTPSRTAVCLGAICLPPISR